MVSSTIRGGRGSMAASAAFSLSITAPSMSQRL
jgi:hypothetical protein